ncbi:hypothetical protein D3C83_85270 [compost metagenome]
MRQLELLDLRVLIENLAPLVVVDQLVEAKRQTLRTRSELDASLRIGGFLFQLAQSFQLSFGA